jgi:hypothetical protein
MAFLGSLKINGRKCGQVHRPRRCCKNFSEARVKNDLGQFFCFDRNSLIGGSYLKKFIVLRGDQRK